MWTIADDVRAQLTSNLQAVVAAGREQIAQQSNALVVESRFVDSVTALVDSECSEFRSHYDIVLSELMRYRTFVEAFNKGQLRAVEDLNDLAERFLVLCRISEERADAKDEMKAAKTAVERARGAYNRAVQSDSPKQYELCSKFTAAIDKAVERIRKVQELDRQFITAKQTYNEFRNRRTRQSYLHLAAALGEVKAAEAEVWQRVDAKITEVQGTFRDGPPKPADDHHNVEEPPNNEQKQSPGFEWPVIDPFPQSNYSGGNPFMED
jgi:hypothetical protein